MSSVYGAIVNKIKDEHEKYDLSYTAFRALVHSQSLCEELVEEIVGIYEALSPSIAGNVPYSLPKCTACDSTDVRQGDITINDNYWVQDLHCNTCCTKFGRFNEIVRGGGR